MPSEAGLKTLEESEDTGSSQEAERSSEHSGER